MASRTTATVLIALLVAPVFVHAVFVVSPGVASFIVVGGSMEPTISQGSIVYVQETGDYRAGDVISFRRDDQVVTHRIVTEVPGGYVTKGDGNDAADSWHLADRQVIGEVILTVPHYGSLLSFVGSRIGFAIVVFLPGVTLIGLEARRLITYLRGRP